MLAVTYVFSPTTTIKSSEVNQNFSDVVNFLNNIFQPGIVFWFNGAVGTIPSAYYYCDGNNGTPNLKKRCIRGVGDGLNLGDTGGSEEHTLTIDQIPNHNHGGGNHGHGVNDPGHSHQYYLRQWGSDGSGIPRGGSDNGTYTKSTQSSGTGIWLSNSGTIITPQGGGQAHNILNPFIALVPIMIK